ncbi:hypothetical protein O8W32_00715 [Methanomassiliicoccales archaeon LGM-DZ1]|nr:hypothetical protein O8W32_00715 [Methanomassiliicoccales archaeon LGM-DZ1]
MVLEELEKCFQEAVRTGIALPPEHILSAEARHPQDRADKVICTSVSRYRYIV